MDETICLHTMQLQFLDADKSASSCQENTLPATLEANPISHRFSTRRLPQTNLQQFLNWTYGKLTKKDLRRLRYAKKILLQIDPNVSRLTVYA